MKEKVQVKAVHKKASGQFLFIHQLKDEAYIALYKQGLQFQLNLKNNPVVPSLPSLQSVIRPLQVIWSSLKQIPTNFFHGKFKSSHRLCQVKSKV